MSDLLELLHSMLEDGLTWSTAIATILAILKLHESRVKRKHTEDMHRDIQEIKERMGIWTADTSKDGSANSVRKSAARSPLRYLMRTIARIAGTFIKSKGMNKMKNVNWATLIVSLLGAVKLVMESFGMDVISDGQINAIANAVAAIAAILGVLLSHRKQQPTVEVNDYH